ncbi:MAG: hypothetical protein GY853_00765 [PVC group bacterium]|nr:hypothetical protein [PVC group bacterium]
MSAVSDKCIFCNSSIDPSQVPPEHIIPSSIDGTVVTYNVCLKCNSTLGSQVDKELNEHRHVWDARKKHNKLPPSKKPFRFKKKYTISSNGSKTPLVPLSNSNQIITHYLPDGGIRADRNCPPKNDPYIIWLNKERKKVGLSDEDFQPHIDQFLEAREKGSYQGRKIYRDWFFTGQDCFFNEEQTQRAESIMATDTPHRFIAKACVEYSHLLHIEDEIKNMDDLKNHAFQGGLEGTKPHFYQQVHEGDIYYPCHTIAITDNKFIIGIYDIYFVAVDIEWWSEPKIITFIDDFTNKTLRLCTMKNDTIEINTMESFDFRDHDDLGRPTHIRR